MGFLCHGNTAYGSEYGYESESGSESGTDQMEWEVVCLLCDLEGVRGFPLFVCEHDSGGGGFLCLMG